MKEFDDISHFKKPTKMQIAANILVINAYPKGFILKFKENVIIHTNTKSIIQFRLLGNLRSPPYFLIYAPIKYNVMKLIIP